VPRPKRGKLKAKHDFKRTKVMLGISKWAYSRVIYWPSAVNQKVDKYFTRYYTKTLAANPDSNSFMLK